MEYAAITRAFGVITLVLSFGFLFHLKHYREMAKKMVGNPSGFILAGVIPLLYGSFLIHFPSSQINGWNHVLYVIGWIMFLVGVFRIWFVNLWVKIIKDNMTFVPVLFALIGLIFGLLLCFAGYIAPLYS